jgi:hypothetical protein
LFLQTVLIAVLIFPMVNEIQSYKKPPDMPVFGDRESSACDSVLAALGEALDES